MTSVLQVVSELFHGASMVDGTRINQLMKGVATLKKSIEQQEQKFGQDLDALETWLDKKFDVILAQLKDLKTNTKKNPPPAEPIHQWGEPSAFNKNKGQ